MVGMCASIACPITAVSAALSFGATMSRSGFCRMNVSTCATCLLLSCWASEMTSLTSGCCANSFVMSAFCAARYGSALFAWLKATKYCLFSGGEDPPQPASIAATTGMTACLVPISSPLRRHRQHDDHGLNHHLHVAVHILQSQHIRQHAHNQ